MITDIKINYQKIKDRVNAAELLHLASKDKDAERILNDLAKDIQREIKR